MKTLWASYEAAKDWPADIHTMAWPPTAGPLTSTQWHDHHRRNAACTSAQPSTVHSVKCKRGISGKLVMKTLWASYEAASDWPADLRTRA